MKRYVIILFLFTLLIAQMACLSQSNQSKAEEYGIETGAEQMALYLDYLQGKDVGIVANHTSLVNGKNLVDSLVQLGVNLQRIFTPEHGFRGLADAGEHVESYTDSITGIKVISLYGKDYKPTVSSLSGLDIMVFDLQDVGVRFYTYLSTLHYVMEACAENNIPMIVLDRPNPNGFYIDGPVLEKKNESFVGLHPIPIVHGMTLGELAKMINSEYWMNDSVQCDLTVVKCRNYTHKSFYNLPINPSPNLQSMRAIYLYPSLALFEGTIMSIGRGTDSPFTVIGHPEFPDTGFSFIPKPIVGASKNPKHKYKVCYGLNLGDISLEFLRENAELRLDWLYLSYHKMEKGEAFFNSYFNLLAGNNEIKRQVVEGVDIEEIRESWQTQLEEFKKKRKQYLLYPD